MAVLDDIAAERGEAEHATDDASVVATDAIRVRRGRRAGRVDAARTVEVGGTVTLDASGLERLAHRPDVVVEHRREHELVVFRLDDAPRAPTDRLAELHHATAAACRSITESTIP